MSRHVSFPSIEGLHNIVRTYEVYPHIFPETIQYRGKPKLHGTNAGVRLTADTITAQSRTQDLDAQNDNAGFAKWVESRAEYFGGLRHLCELSTQAELRVISEPWDGVVTIFGEWAGKGIMKGTACNMVDTKFFAVFMIVFGSDADTAVTITDPEDIDDLLGRRPDDIYVLPYMGPSLSITWADRASLEAAASLANECVEAFEVIDPWMKETFGVEGVGEGLVYYPQGVDSRKRFGDFAFKAKGEKHKTQKTKEAVQVDPEVAESVGAFVSMFVTEARLEQGLNEIGGQADPKLTGPFLAWVGKDVEKESVAELEASGLDWKQVAKPVSTAARTWFVEKAKAI